MDYEIVCSVLKLLEKAGLDDEEFSFLLGKRNQYFFDLIDPRKKQKLKTDHIAPLRAILDESYREIITNDVAKNEMIQLHHAVRKVNKKSGTITYSHIIYPEPGRAGKTIIWRKQKPKGRRRMVNAAVHTAVKGLLDEGYFREPRPALPLYLHLRKVLHTPFSAADIEKSLAALMRKGGPLVKVKIDSRLHYKE